MLAKPSPTFRSGGTVYLEEIGEIIASRELHLRDKQDSKKTLLVLIGKPQPSPDSGGYYCPFQISGVGSEEIKYAAGVDSVQALQLVMVMIGATLRFLKEELGGNLNWEGSGDGELGFPSVV